MTFRTAALLTVGLLLSANAREERRFGSEDSKPNIGDLIGVWRPNPKSLAEIRTRNPRPQLVEIILRENGTFLFQGIPAKWIDDSKQEMPVDVGAAAGKWKLRKNWDGWEIFLQNSMVSLVLIPETKARPHSIRVQCADSRGNFEVVFHRTLLKE